MEKKYNVSGKCQFPHHHFLLKKKKHQGHELHQDHHAEGGRLIYVFQEVLQYKPFLQKCVFSHKKEEHVT